jgi:hypothetical protein
VLRSEALGFCTGLLCLAAAMTVDAAPRAAYFGPGGAAPHSPEIMLYFSHAVGGGAGGSMHPNFGLRVQQIHQGANNGDPEQGDSMQRRELLSWQMDAHSNMHLSQSSVKLGNRVTYDFASSRFGSPNGSAMQIGTPTLRGVAVNQAQPRSFASRNPLGALAGINSSSSGHDPSRDNSNRDNSSMRDVAAVAVAAMAPTRFASSQRQAAPRQGGLLAVAAAQRVQGLSALR